MNYMLNGKAMIVFFNSWIDKKRNCCIKMTYFPPYKYSKNKKEVELNWNEYARKSDLKNAISVDESQFAKKDDLANLKSEVDKFDINKLSELDADKLKPAPIDLSKLNDVVKKWCC